MEVSFRMKAVYERGKKPVLLRFDAFHVREHGPSLLVYIHD